MTDSDALLRSLSRRATEAIQFNPGIALKYWLRSAESVLKQAKIYNSEHDNVSAYVLYVRFSELVLNVLPRHPKKLPEDRKILRRLQLVAKEALDNADQLKELLITSQLKLKSKLRPTAKTVLPSPPKNKPYFDISGELQQLGLELKRQSPDPISTAKASDESNESYPDLPPKEQHQVSTLQTPTSPEKDFISSVALENGISLRTVFVAADLRARFLEIARPNTSQNLETCGILCGSLKRNAFFISTLIIPAQECTSDSCSTTDETALFELQDSRDLLTLGWIHTHPTQTCFMSSVDLHTHCSYQLMLPEAVAVVLAPRVDSWGAFRLTDPPGVQIISSCRATSLFHPHPESNTYVDAMWRAGHLREVKDLKYSVIDMR